MERTGGRQSSYYCYLGFNSILPILFSLSLEFQVYVRLYILDYCIVIQRYKNLHVIDGPHLFFVFHIAPLSL